MPTQRFCPIIEAIPELIAIAGRNKNKSIQLEIPNAAKKFVPTVTINPLKKRKERAIITCLTEAGIPSF